MANEAGKQSNSPSQGAVSKSADKSRGQQVSRERGTAMRELCEAASGLLDQEVWSAAELAVALDSLTDGLWLRMHLDPDSMDNVHAHRITLRAIAAAFPSRHTEILAAPR